MSDADLQYPIGKFTRPTTFSAAERVAAIATLAEFPRRLSAAVEGLNDAQLDTPYRPEGWTIRQVVHHVADSHMNAYSRFRHALTMDWPAIYAYDQGAWAKLPDSQLPVDGSLRIIEALHERWVVTLRGVVEADWAGRGYVHPENGRQALGDVLPLYAWHSRHHLAHVVNSRQRCAW
jgi:hypothetical protein